MAQRTALVTGCSSGIGRALADELATRGFVVYATARKDADLESLELAGHRAVRLDVTHGDEISAVAERIRSEIGHLDVLINNAGFNAVGAVIDVTPDTLRRQLEANVVGPIALIQACFELLRGRDSRIVNIGSVVGVMTTPFAGPYSASKAALHRLSDALRMEVAPFGIHVVTVQPGAIRSAMGDNATANATIDPGSPYAVVADQVEARARLSQEDKPTPADEFARFVLDKVLAEPPPAVVRGGRRSALLPIMDRLLPKRTSDRIFTRRFHLDRLGTNHTG